MGGENSEITENTKRCCSSPAFSRQYQKNIKEVGACFGFGSAIYARVEPVNAYLALERAVELVHELGAGTVVGEVIDVNYADISQRVIEVDTSA